MRMNLTALGIAVMGLMWLGAPAALDPGPSIAPIADLSRVAADLSVMEEAHLLMARELRSGFIRCDVGTLFGDGPVEVTGPVDATITSVEAGRIALLSPTESGSVNLRRGSVGATMTWPAVGPGELRWCTSFVSTPLTVKDS